MAKRDTVEERKGAGERERESSIVIVLEGLSWLLSLSLAVPLSPERLRSHFCSRRERDDVKLIGTFWKMPGIHLLRARERKTRHDDEREVRATGTE